MNVKFSKMEFLRAHQLPSAKPVIRPIMQAFRQPAGQEFSQPKNQNQLPIYETVQCTDTMENSSNWSQSNSLLNSSTFFRVWETCIDTNHVRLTDWHNVSLHFPPPSGRSLKYPTAFTLYLWKRRMLQTEMVVEFHAALGTQPPCRHVITSKGLTGHVGARRKCVFLVWRYNHVRQEL